MAYNLRPRSGVTVETLGPVSHSESRNRADKGKDKVWNNYKVLAFLVIFRWVNVALVQTSFVPDEYWQSLEVAHKMVFGYGYKTWEWQKGLRGYTYPAVFALVFKTLSILNLDYPIILIFAPRFLQATLSAFGDFCLYKTSCLLHGNRVGKRTFIVNTSSWFVFYNSTRTLTNTMETTLTCVALYFFPWPQEWVHDKKNRPQWNPRLYIAVVALACIIRPTAAVLWLPLCLWHIKFSVSFKRFKYSSMPLINILVFLTDGMISAVVLFLPVGLIALGLSLSIDGYFYGYFVFVQKNFLEFNFIHDLGSFYGSHPWHWYFTQGFPVVMATHLISFLLGAKIGFRKNSFLLFVIVWTIFIYSFASHKEFRFIYPVVPICMLFCGLFAEHACRYGRTKFILDALLLLNIPAWMYFGLVHQRGMLDVMGFVRSIAEEHDASLHRSVLFLMPCHSTPYYSHVHSELPMRFLECPPPFSRGDSSEEESAVFYNNPLAWLNEEYPDGASTPTHLIFFDVLKEEIQEFLSDHSYEEVANYFHTHIPEGKMGARVLVYQSQFEDLPER